MFGAGPFERIDLDSARMPLALRLHRGRQRNRPADAFLSRFRSVVSGTLRSILNSAKTPSGRSLKIARCILLKRNLFNAASIKPWEVIGFFTGMTPAGSLHESGFQRLAHSLRADKQE